MPTSLAEQLQRLAVPQSSSYKEDRRKASLLFDPKEAATKDRDTFYEIGLNGLNGLKSLYDGFHIYEDTLFGISSKEFERAVQSKEANVSLDSTIEKFLRQLSPYFQLQSTHKALEWLVNRFQIHQYNQDAVMALILPYHETMIFVRFIQIMDIKSNSNRWNWLQPLQKPGIPLAKQVLYNHCSSDLSLLQFISKNTWAYVQDFGERAPKLNAVYAFFCSTAIGTIDASKRMSESLIIALLSTIMKALNSPVDDFRSSAYIVIGYLSSQMQLKEATLNEFISRIIISEYTLTYDMALLANLMYTSQTEADKITENVLYDISLDRIQQLCVHLNTMIKQKISVMPFMLIFMTSVLRLVQVNMEEFKRLCKLPEIMINDVDIKTQSPKDLILCVLRVFDPSSFQESDGYESDIEIIDDNKVISNEMTDWYSGLLRNLEQKYPDAFDVVIKSEFNAKKEITEKRHAQLTKILGFKPAVAHKFGDNYLFENLNHANPTIRVEAVRYLSEEFVSLKSDDANFLKDSIINRFNDDDADVVKAVLKIPILCIEEILSPEELTECFVKIISKSKPRNKKWQKVVRETIDVFCSLDILNVNQEIILALFPYLFPKDKETSVIALQIMSSAWGKKFALTETAVKKLQMSKVVLHTQISEVVFAALNNLKWDKSWVQIFPELSKRNTLNMCLFLFMKSFTLADASVEESAQFLNDIVDFAKTEEIVPYRDASPLSSQIMAECIQLCAEDKILFPMIQYLFAKVIEEAKVTEISKPWCNVCDTPESMLLKQIFEICIIGCGLPNYSTAYCSLLQQFLNKFCSNAQEKLEFIANFACGHMLFAKSAQAIITPELQLRSLKLLKNCIEQSDVMPWMYESNIIYALLFALNNPLSVARQCAIGTIEIIISKNGESASCFHRLFQELISRKNELILDHKQIQQVLYLLLSQDKSAASTVNKITRSVMKVCLQEMIGMVTNDSTPAHVSSELLTLLTNVNSADILTKISPVASSLHRVAESVHQKWTFGLDVYESKLLRNIYSRINQQTIKSIEKEQVWEMITSGIKEYKEIVINEYQTLVSPCFLILKQIDGESFKVFPDNRAVDFILNVCFASTFSNNPGIVSVAAKMIKKIDLKIEHFKDILTSMLNVIDPATKIDKKRSSSSITMLSHQTAETESWKLGVTILEYIQSKKKLTVDNMFMPLLFKLLQKCLEFEEQSYVEYTKQLILSSVWFYCQKFVNQDNSKQIKTLKASFDIELVVKCIRGTQNPQTHHHALMLLSHAAYILPEQVLNHTMAIFTFIGSSVLMHDDAYSFQIIIKIIETIIPILTQLDKDVEEYSEKELQQLQGRVVPVLRIFAVVVLDVPEHRRLLLYKKLIETLGPSRLLWVFLALLIETHTCHWKGKQEKRTNEKRSLAEQELPIDRLDFGKSLLLEFSAEVGLENFIQLIRYLKTLPLQKSEDMVDTGAKPSDIFSVSDHSYAKLRHYIYTIVTFMNTCLSSPYFIQHARSVDDPQVMEKLYKTLIINILMFITSISKVRDETDKAYWKLMLQYSYDLLDNVNNLLLAPMFVSVVRGLLAHNLLTVRRKTMDLLNSKIQYNPEMFAECDKDHLYSLLSPLNEIVKTIDSQDDNVDANVLKKLVLNQQTALLSLKLMTRMLAAENPAPFKPILECVTEYTCRSEISENVMASIVLCLAELCSNLKAHAISSLPIFMPALIDVLNSQQKEETPELITLSTITALSKIIESLPLFLSPYLKQILCVYSTLMAKWHKRDQDCSKVSAVVAKLTNIKKRMASSIAPRVLIPVTRECYDLHVVEGNLDAIGPLMSVLAESFTHITAADFRALQQDLTTFYLTALQLRSDTPSIDAVVVDNAEDEIVNALVCLVLKLSETSFRPFYFKIYDWAIRTNVDNEKDRAITFYRLSSVIADKLKGLFVLFAGHFIKNASQLLDLCNKSKTEELYFESEEKCTILIQYILKTLHIVFLYDSQNFVNKDRFETLMQPIVDQLENTLGGMDALKVRCKDLLWPCISQFAVAIADDSLWKPLNYQILLKTRHNEAEIRMLALDCLVSTASQLGGSWLPLLAESVPFLAELLEDGDARIESSTKEAVRKLQLILGEPLQKYF